MTGIYYWVECIGLSNRSSVQQVRFDLQSALKVVEDDLSFIHFLASSFCSYV